MFKKGTIHPDKIVSIYASNTGASNFIRQILKRQKRATYIWANTILEDLTLKKEQRHFRVKYTMDQPNLEKL